MTQTNIRATDRPTSRDASHLKIKDHLGIYFNEVQMTNKTNFYSIVSCFNHCKLY